MACDTCGNKPKNESNHFPKAVIEINNPETLTLLRKVVVPASMGDDTAFPPSIGKYRNVLLHYDIDNKNYLYSSDGIPTLLDATIPPEIYERIANLEDGLAQEVLDRKSADTTLDNKITALDNSLATVAKTGSYNDLLNKPTIGSGVLTIQKNSSNVGTFNANATTNSTINLAIPLVDTAMSTSSGNAIANSTISNKLNKNLVTDISLNANTSTTTVQIDGAKENIYTGVTSTKNIALPVASTTQAGVMNSSTFDAVTANTNNLNAIMNGAVAITGIAASPSQSDLTTAWQTETGLTTLINRASIYDVDNNKVWTYYTNDTTWHAASNTSQVTINTFTNSSEGTIKGSTNVGQIFAENDGTGSVNGWDTLSSAVSTNTSDIASLQAAIPTVNDATLTIQNNGTNVATFTANSATSATANIIPPVQIGSVLSTPSSVTYVDTANIYDGAVTASKLAQYAVNSTIVTENNLSPAEDTVSAWETLFNLGGHYITYYNVADKFANQPNQYGFLETILKRSNHALYQKWTTHATGPSYYRMGNLNGWWGSSSAAGTFREIVDNNVTTGTFSMESGYTKYADSSFVKRVGNLVTWQLRFTNTSQISSEVQIATISSGFRPPQPVWTVGILTTGGSPSYVSVLDNGAVYVKPSNNIGASSTVILSGTYFVN